jgi:hypothetical protein
MQTVHEGLLMENSPRLYLGQVVRVSRSENPPVYDFVDQELSPMEILFDVGNIISSARAIPLEQTSEVNEGDYVVIMSFEHIYNNTYYYHAIRDMRSDNDTIYMKYRNSEVRLVPVSSEHTDLVLSSNNNSKISLESEEQKLSLESGDGGININSLNGIINIKNKKTSLHKLLEDLSTLLLEFETLGSSGISKTSPRTAGKLLEFSQSISSLLGDISESKYLGLKLSSEQKLEKFRERQLAADFLQDDSLSPLGRSTGEEYDKLLQFELESGEANSEATENSTIVIDPNQTCESGRLVVEIALRDLGILEFNSPQGKNFGGFKTVNQTGDPGRIDQMVAVTGLDNIAKTARTGSGYFWCAAAVATWWKEAGLEIPSGSASCDSWMNWAKKKGYWSQTPIPGAAVLYGKPTDAVHIGIVAQVEADGSIQTIEGNTSGTKEFSRNGCGVFIKKPRKYLGFVIPPTCIN